MDELSMFMRNVLKKRKDNIYCKISEQFYGEYMFHQLYKHSERAFYIQKYDFNKDDYVVTSFTQIVNKVLTDVFKFQS